MRGRRYKEFPQTQGRSILYNLWRNLTQLALDFHHLDESQKEYQISDLVYEQRKDEKRNLRSAYQYVLTAIERYIYYGADKFSQVQEAL